MQEPKQDKRKVLYDAVSKDYSIGTYDEFVNKLNDPTKRKSFYDGVGSEYNLGNYDEFESKIGVVKKKDGTKPNSTSTSASQKQDLVQKNGSSGTPQFEYKPIKDERGREVFEKDASGNLVPAKEKVLKGYASSTEERGIVREELKQKALKEVKPSVKYQEYKVATQPKQEEIDLLSQEVDAEINQQGFLNGLKTGAKKGVNFLADAFTAIGTLGTETDGPEVFDEQPFSKEYKEAEKQLLSEFEGEKSRVTPDAIKERTKKIVLDKKVTSLKVDKNNEFLSKLPESEKKALELERVSQYKTISDRDKYLATESSLLVNELERLSKDYAIVKAIAEKASKNGTELTPEFIEKSLELENNLTSKVDDYQKLEKEYSENTEEIGSAEEEVDFLKRNYSGYEKFKTNVKLGLGDLYVNVSKGLPILISDLDDMTLEKLRFGSGEGIMSEEERKVLIDEIIDWESAKSQTKDKYKRDVEFSSLNTGNIGQFIAQEVGTQIPIFAQMALPGGVVSIGVTSAADKYGQMEMESNQISFNFKGNEIQGYQKEDGSIVDGSGFSYNPDDVKITSFIKPDYSKSQMLATAVGFGTAEAVLGALPTKNALGRVVRSFENSNKRQLLRNGFKSFVTKPGKEAFKESWTEGATSVIQNFLDIKVLGKNDVGLFDNVDHAMFTGGLLGGMMGSVPTIAGLASRPFSNKTETKLVRKNLTEILALREQLNNPDISDAVRKATNDKINTLEVENNTVLTNIAERSKGLTKEAYEAIVSIDKKQELLRLQASEIKADKSIKDDFKQQLLNDLKVEFNMLEDKRSTLNTKEATILDTLSDSEKSKLRNEATEIIKSEHTGDGEAKIDDKQVTKKAIELYEKSNAVQQEATTTEEKSETQPQAEVQETEQEAITKEDIEVRRKETESKIKRKDLFSDGGTFSNILGESGVDSVPTRHTETNGIEFVEFSNPNTGIVDVVMSGTSSNDFVGYYRVYENGKPTEKWSSKFENQSRNKENFKTMIGGVQSMLPKGHQYTEKTSISTDGLRIWEQQLNRGYELQYDNNGNLITNEVAINGDAIVNELGIDVNQGNFDNISVTNRQQFESVKKALLPYLQKLGLNESNIRNVNGTVEIDLPVLRQKTNKEQSNNNQINNADNYLGTPTVTQTEDGDLYEFKTKDGIIAGVMVSPTEFRIDGISANETGKGMGSKMFENLIDHLKNKGVDTITTKSAGEGAVKMHQKAVDKGLLTEVSKNGREATFNINKNESTQGENNVSDEQKEEGAREEKVKEDSVLDRILNQDELKDTFDFLDSLKIDPKDLKATLPFLPNVWNAFIDGVKLSMKAGNTMRKAIIEAKNVLESQGFDKLEINKVLVAFQDKFLTEEEKAFIDGVLNDSSSEENSRKFSDMASKFPNTEEVGLYMSGDTYEKYMGVRLENNQEMFRMRLIDALKYGIDTIQVAVETFGDNFVDKVLDYIESNNISIESKSLLLISLENELERQKIADPTNKDIQEKLNLVLAKRQAFASSVSKALNMNRLKAFAKAGFDKTEITDKMFSDTEKRAKRKVETAVESTFEDINNEDSSDEFDSDFVIAEPKNKRSKEDAKKDLNDALKALKEDWKNLKKGVTLNVTIPGYKQIEVATPHILKMAKAMVEIGGYNTKEIIETIYDNLKGTFNGVKKSDISNILKEDQTKSKPKKNQKMKDLVKEALINRGFFREVNVKQKDGTREVKKYLDWKKLAGKEGTLENIKKKTEEALKDLGYTDSQIEKMQDALIEELTDLRASIIEKSMNELDNRNRIKDNTERKNIAKKLSELYNFGLFEKAPDAYQNLLNSAIGFNKFKEKQFEELTKLAESLSILFSFENGKNNNNKLSQLAIKTQTSIINQEVKAILNFAAFAEGHKGFKLTYILREFAGLSQRAKLLSMKQFVENPFSGFVERKFQQVGEFFMTKEDGRLVANRKKLSKHILNDIIQNGGSSYGDVTTVLTSETAIEGWLNKQSDNRLYHLMLTNLTGRAYLEAADSMNKALLTEKMFTQNLVKLLSSKGSPLGRMSKSDAMKYVADKITGQNFEDALKLAGEVIDKVNDEAGKNILPKTEQNIYRFANDIVKESLSQGTKMDLELVEKSYNAAYKSAGFNIGHEANNVISRNINAWSSSTGIRLDRAIKQKKWNLATIYNLESILVRNILNPFVGGGTNWVVLTAQKAGVDPISIFADLANSIDNKIDLTTDEGMKNLENALVRSTNMRNTSTRTLIGAAVSLSMAAAFVASGKGDDLEDWLKENEWARKYFKVLSPTVINLMMAIEKGEFSEFAADMVSIKSDNFNQTLNFIKSFDNDKRSTLGELGRWTAQPFDTPLPWRFVKDIDNIQKGIRGIPQYKSDYRVTGFLNGFFQGGAVDYIGLRPEGDPSFNKKKKKKKSQIRF